MMRLESPYLASGERRLPQAALGERVARAAGGLRRLGIADGGVIALMLRNDFAFFEASLAVGMANAYATPINWHFTPDEAGYILRDCGARAVVVHADLWPAIAPVVPDGMTVLMVPTPEEIQAAYHLDPAAAVSPPDALLWDDWVARQEPLVGGAARPYASIIYTSGTTGRPKGVRRAQPTPEHVARIRVHGETVWGLRAGEPATVLMNGPMYHSAPNSYGLAAARAGATIVLQPRFDPEELLSLVERHRVTHMHIVPTMFVRLLKLPAEVRQRYDLSSLRFVVHGAAPCPAAVKRSMIEWWGPVINEYYGSTETGVVIFHGSDEALRKPGTVGQAVEGAVVKILGPENRELPPGQIGELYMRAAHLPDFTYHGQDDKRREVGHGDLVTVGDIGWLDEDGYVFLCDRKRDMVISGGVNIYPAEIESVLIGMPGIKDCAVFGIPDEEFGESLCAYLEPEPGDAAPGVGAVRAFLARRLARYKIPKVIEVAADLPREDSGKIFKRKLRAPYWEKHGRSI